MMRIRRAKYEIYLGEDNQWYWRLKAANGEIVSSSEGYSTKWNAKRSIWTMRRLAMFARVVEEV